MFIILFQFTQRASPLAELYSTSTMEQHHFNYTVSIIQVQNLIDRNFN